MQIKKKLFRICATVLCAVTLAGNVSALPLIGSAKIYAKPGIASKVTVGAELSVGDAAMRLYYLGILNGSGTNVNGGVDFNLDRGLTRVESAVFAVRLMGQEKEALKLKKSHPYTDVPAWASDYVGYIYSCGLITDIGGELFEPSKPESTARFMSYILYTLGYRIEKKDYTYLMATKYVVDAGISNVRENAPLTRGDAIMTMYNVLRTTIKGSSRVYSDVLVEKGVISYQDAVFMLWNRNQEETETYMKAMSYGTEWVLPDGYYKIKSHESGKMLNVAVDGKNRDYEGVPVTLWDNTNDVSQTFRLERTEKGTYYIYSAASRNGYGRVIGTGTDGKTGLFSETGAYAEEFYITCNGEGYFTISSASNKALTLTCNEFANGKSVILGNTEAKTAPSMTWELERQGVLNSSGKEIAIFVADSLVITQGAYDNYSHQRQNALDLGPVEQMVRAPFNATIVRIDPSYYACNAVWIQSTSKVLYADGTYDYMTALFMHDNYIGDLYVGQGLAQGEYFYHIGDYGVSSGKHVHLAIYRGKYHYGMTLGSGDVFAEDALFLPDTTYIYNDYGLDWKFVSLAD